MKILTNYFLILSLGLTPAFGMAQQNIITSFDAILNCSEAHIFDKHTLQKDPDTGVKIGQADIYNFSLPISKFYLLQDAVNSIKADSEMAYDILHGHTSSIKNDYYSIWLPVGQGDSGVSIYTPDSEYICAYFLAPKSEDPEGKSRYAYGIIYKEENEEITGKLAVTYSTTLAYRQAKNNAITDLSTNKQQKTWFESLMSLFQSMSQANSQTRIALATRAYELIKKTNDYPDTTETDKESVREILKAMISDNKYSETILNKLLKQCLQNIK